MVAKLLRLPAAVPAVAEPPDAGAPPDGPLGRSLERRRWSAELLGSTAGLVLHGPGGIGKSALAAEIATRACQLEPERVTTVIRGELSADRFLASLAATVRRYPVAAPRDGERAAALEAADRIDLPWPDRLAGLREHVLGQVPVLVLLDDFDDNLDDQPPAGADPGAGAGARGLRDQELAGLLASWGGVPHLGRLLITCRQEFTLPGGAERGLGFRRVGPLSRSDAAELAGALPELSELSGQQLDQAWRLTGGNPRSLGYLDALLARTSFAGLVARLGGLAADPGGLLLGALWDSLTPGAQDLLIGVSVYRAPVGRTVSVLPDSREDRAAELTELVAQCAAAGLLAIGSGQAPPTMFMHRWTASELHRRLTGAQRGDELTEAHRRAARYWQSRVVAHPQDRQALLEAGYHLRQAGDLTPRNQPPASPPVPPERRRQRGLGLLAGAAAVVVCLVVAVLHLASSVTPGSGDPSRLATAGDPATLRAQAADWFAHQVSRGATVDCAPVMCAALRAHGVAAGQLRLLPGTGRPPAADVLIGTAGASRYAPGVIASFGAGPARIEVCAMAPQPAAAYRSALAADLTARMQEGRALVTNPRISLPAAARAELAGGQVNIRLVIVLGTMADTEPVRVLSFGDPSPGAGSHMPLRAVRLAASGTGISTTSTGPAGLRGLLTFVRAQQPPYRAASAGISSAAGVPVLAFEFPAPSPVGLLGSGS